MKVYPKNGILVLGIALIFFSCTKTYTYERIDKVFEPIISKYGIKIVYEINEEFSPIRNGGVRVRFTKVKKIEPRVLSKYPQILAMAFKKYPTKVIKNNINAIYFAKEMEYNGLQYGGTYDSFRRIIFLANDGEQTDDRSIAIFHHELSSLLLDRYGFLINPWFNQNPKNFKYRSDTNGSWKNAYNGTSIVGTISDYEKGFLNSYSQTNFENDFNEYSRLVFSYPQKFKKIMNQYPRVRGKFLVFLEFYHKIDPIFTEEYLLGEK